MGVELDSLGDCIDKEQHKSSAASAGYACMDCGFTIRDSRNPHDCWLSGRRALMEIRQLCTQNHESKESFISRVKEIINYT